MAISGVLCDTASLDHLHLPDIFPVDGQSVCLTLELRAEHANCYLTPRVPTAGEIYQAQASQDPPWPFQNPPPTALHLPSWEPCLVVQRLYSCCSTSRWGDQPLPSMQPCSTRFHS